MNKIKFIITTVVLFFCVSSAFAQSRRITGVVNDDFGGVAMANVVERDNNNRIVAATVTDMNGNFALVIKNPKDKLVISYIGLQTYTEVIGTTKTKYNIFMKDASQLKEVVIKAKPMSKAGGLVIPVKEIVGATQTMSMDDVQGLSFASADEALQGKIAGLDIIQNSGNLGSGTSMRLRGVSSINGSAEPLIVVNGNIFDAPEGVNDIDFNDMDNEEQFATLLSVNPEDILNIEVLKDAASCGEWGSRGANGVIKITTRRGVAGKTKINFSYRFTGSWAPSGLNMLDGDGYTMMMKEAYFNPKQNTATSDMVELNYDKNYPVQYYNFNKNTDWVKEVNQFGQTHNYYLTISGGGEKAKFRISGGYDHQTGTIIKQSLDRFSTRLALDYDVSDRIRFTTDFALTYTDNHRNWDGNSISTILGKAYNVMPNMSVYEYDQNGNLTGDYYKMLPTITTTGAGGNNNYSSYYLSDMKDIGNPVAIANQAFNNMSTYDITPQFKLTYKLLGKDTDSHQLDLEAEAYMRMYNQSVNTYYPSTLTTNAWSNGVNSTMNEEKKTTEFTNKEILRYVPKTNRDIWTASAAAQFEFRTGNGTSQTISQNGVPTGITSSIAEAYLTGSSSGTWQWRDMALMFSAQAGFFDGRYSITARIRRDGSTKFGKGRKWGNFPSVGVRWNITDEPFFKKLKLEKIISMLSVQPSWGMVGNLPKDEYLMYNKYSSAGVYGKGNNTLAAITAENLRLTDIKWETTKSWNVGANLNFLDDLLQFNFNYYNKNTSDLLMAGVGIPGSTGYNSLAWKNVGSLKNEGWELFLNTGKFAKVGKMFAMTANFNIAQNVNTITSMDESVLLSMNGEYSYNNGEYLKRIQVGNAVGSIYGFRYKGVYRYDYEHNGYTKTSAETYGSNTAAAAEARGENATVPVARNANGDILYDSKGNPLHMYFNYGGKNYEFKGGDAIYEDINHDGQINELDIVYLGNSNPKINGGFGLNFFIGDQSNFGQISIKFSFNFRLGNMIANTARLNNESMRSNVNQSAAVAWRWRKNGDITEIPRAMNASIGASYNALASDRYVEKGDYLRLQYMQIGYSIPSKWLKGAGINSLRFTASANNLFCLTKYTGVDPEVSYGAWGVCYDNSKTPRAKSFTLSVNLGF